MLLLLIIYVVCVGHTRGCQNSANGTRMISCIVSSVIIVLCFFQIIVNISSPFFYRNKLLLIRILIHFVICFCLFSLVNNNEGNI